MTPASNSRPYLICATPRSGSTLLCQCLILTGQAGFPSEWVLPDTFSLAQERFGIIRSFDDPRYLAEIVERTSTPNGVFGIKLMGTEIARLRQPDPWISPLRELVSEKAALSSVRFVRIFRRDALRQAVSLVISKRTGHWHKLAADEDISSGWPCPCCRRSCATRTNGSGCSQTWIYASPVSSATRRIYRCHRMQRVSQGEVRVTHGDETSAVEPQKLRSAARSFEAPINQFAEKIKGYIFPTRDAHLVLVRHMPPPPVSTKSEAYPVAE
jgi:Stf0 sulphotransferase